MTKNLGTPNINQSKETKISPYKIKNNSFWIHEQHERIIDTFYNKEHV